MIIYLINYNFNLKDQIIIPLMSTGLKDETKDDKEEEDPLLVVHPNYVIES